MLKKWLATLLAVALLLTMGILSFSVQGASATTTIFDARVNKTYSLKPNAQLSISGLTSAIQNDVSRNGVAERYIVTINGSTKRNDYVYPVLVGSEGSEAWIEESLDFNFQTSRSKRDIYGTIFVEDYYEAGEVPIYLLLISESENASFTISRVKVQAVHETAATTTTTKKTTTTTKKTTTTTKPTTTTTKKTTTTTKPTTTTTKAPANDSVIFDAAVSKTLTLAPGATLANDAINAALAAENAAHGIAERYVITVQADCSQADIIYPILITTAGTEGWPKMAYSSIEIGQSGTIVGTILGSSLEGSAPQYLFFYAESKNATLTIKHIKIEVVRASSATTTKSTTTTTKPTTTTTKKTTTTTKPTTTTTKKTTTTTKPTTTTTTKAPANDTVIYNAAVSKTLTLAPGATLANDAINAALAAENAAHGIAEQYVITVQADCSPTDIIYPILLSGSKEAWPKSSLSSLEIGQNGTIVGTILGSSLDGNAPQTLFFYADGKNATLTIRHIKIEVVRAGQGTGTSTTTRPTTAGTTSGGSSGSDGRPTGSGDYTVVNGVPYITFRRYGEQGTLGTWWWYTEDATNTTTRDLYLNFLYMNGVDEIYFYGYYWCASSSSRSKLHTFVEKANAKGMKVSLIYDDVASITAKGNTEMSKVATNYLNYCAAYPSDQMAGIHFDVEEGSHDNKVNYMISQFAAARARGVYIAMDVGCGWTCTATLNGISGFFNIAAANVDCLSMMSYRDDGDKVWSFGAKGFNAAKTYGCKIVLGVETDNSGEGDQVDFSGEDQKTCYTELAKVFRHLKADHPAGGYGVAVHHVRCWYNLKKG